MRKPGIIVLLSIVMGALFAALVYRQLREQEAAIEAARRAAHGESRELLVASEPIPIGTNVEERHVRLVPWPVDLQPAGAIREAAAATGRVARTSIEANQPLLESQLVAQGAGLLPLLIEEGKRAMSVKVDAVTGVSGFITPNSRVDVLVSGNPEGQGGGEQRSKVILQNVRVLATGTTIEQKDEKPVEVPTVTLLVLPEEAERLTLAARQEPVRLALRNYRDEGVVKTGGISTEALLGGEDPPPPPPPARRGRGSRPQGRTVELILGSQVVRQAVR